MEKKDLKPKPEATETKALPDEALEKVAGGMYNSVFASFAERILEAYRNGNISTTTIFFIYYKDERCIRNYLEIVGANTHEIDAIVNLYILYIQSFLA